MSSDDGVSPVSTALRKTASTAGDAGNNPSGKLPFPSFQMKVESNLELSKIKIHQKASILALFRLVYKSQAQFTNDIIHQ